MVFNTFNIYGAGPPLLISRIGPVRGRPLPPTRARPVFTLLDDQQTVLHASAADVVGNPSGSFDAPPTWSVDDSSVVTIAPSPDGLACQVVTTGKLGVATVTLSAMAGGKAVSDTFPITVGVDVPASVNITADAPTSRPPPATDQPAANQPAGAT